MPARPSDFSPELPGVGLLIFMVVGVGGAALYLTPLPPGTWERVGAGQVLFLGLVFLAHILLYLSKGYRRRKHAYDKAVRLRHARVLPGRVVEARHIRNVVWTGDTALVVDYEFKSPEGENVRAQAVELGERTLPPENAELAVLYGDRQNFVLL